jgi:hypothetical protein
VSEANDLSSPFIRIAKHALRRGLNFVAIRRSEAGAIVCFQWITADFVFVRVAIRNRGSPGC